MKLRILDIPVDMVTMRDAIEKYRELMNGEKFQFIVTPNSEIIVNATKDERLKEIIEQASLVIPDGIGLVYASKILRSPLKERVTGIDFFNYVLLDLADTGKSLYILGGKPGVAEAAAKKMVEKMPKLNIVGIRDGYFGSDDEYDIVEEINASGADFLCVALGSPKQERFMANYADDLNPKVGVGVGGTLDVWAEVVKRAPEFYQKHGLEWFYRLVQQPSRYKRMAALPLFMVKVVKSSGKSKRNNQEIHISKVEKSDESAENAGNMGGAENDESAGNARGAENAGGAEKKDSIEN